MKTSGISHFSIDDFIKARSEGSVTLKSSRENLEQFVQLWLSAASPNVLVDLRGRKVEMSVEDLTLVCGLFAKSGLGYLNKVAFVYDVRPSFDPAKFFEFLARQRGMRLVAFDCYEDAIEWLGESTPLKVEPTEGKSAPSNG